MGIFRSADIFYVGVYGKTIKSQIRGSHGGKNVDVGLLGS
jgi:hypothetical protein